MTASDQLIKAARFISAVKITPIRYGEIRCRDCEGSFGQLRGHYDVDGYVCPIASLVDAITLYDESVSPAEPLEASFVADCAWCGNKQLLTTITETTEDLVSGPCPTEDCAATLTTTPESLEVSLV